MNKCLTLCSMVIVNFLSLPALAQSYPGFAEPEINPWQDRTSSRTRPGAVPSNWNVFSRAPFNGDYATTAGLADLSVNPKPIPSGKFNLGFGGPKYFQPGPYSSAGGGGESNGNGNGNGGEQQVSLPYTPGPDWAPVYNSHDGSLMGYMAPGETLEQFFSGESGHILPSQAAEGQWILQNQLGGIGGETAAQFAGF